MTGDYRDGSGLSFTPRERTSKTVGYAMATLLIFAGIGLAIGGVVIQQQSEPLHIGGRTAIGVLVGYEKLDSSEADEYAMVQFNAGSRTIVAHSENPVDAGAQKEWGAIYEVKYDSDRPERTYIEGLDQLEEQPAWYGGAGGAFLLGFIFCVRPPERRIRSQHGGGHGAAVSEASILQRRT